MDYLKSLIPKDKFDSSTVEKLSLLTDKEIQPIIKDLLEWLQDYNWPIAKDILPLVILHQNIAITHILDVLKGNDIMWQYWIIDLVIPDLTITNKLLLKNELKRISLLEKVNEDIEMISETAKECLAYYYS